MNIPQHVAIILDGNGRWAKSKGMPRNYGHARGAKNLEKICRDAYDIGIKYLTVYLFSTENGKRSALWCIVAWNFKLLLWRCTVCGRNVPIYSGNFCENGGISDPVDAFVSVYGNRPKQTADLRGQSLAVWEK